MLAAIAGGLIATFFPFTILSGGVYELKSFVIGVLGGLGNPLGALAGRPDPGHVGRRHPGLHAYHLGAGVGVRAVYRDSVGPAEGPVWSEGMRILDTNAEDVSAPHQTLPGV